jgi:quercetin dioxygenase-like cupin family protein
MISSDAAKQPEAYPLEPKYKRDNGLYVLDTDTASLPFPKDFEVRDTSVVYLPAGQIAGNHKHPRQEAYVCCDEGVELHWLDETGKVHIEQMVKPGENPQLFIMPPHIPHAVVNASGHNITLVGFADSSLENVESVEVAVLDKKAGSGLTDLEAAQVTRLLSKLEPGFLPFGIFHEVSRLVATPIIEVVPLRISPDGKIEVLLLRREADDPVWPGQLHVPGTVVRASDAPHSFDDPLNRIFTKELGGVKLSAPVFVKNIFHNSGRGMEASQIYWVEVQSEDATHEFYDIDNLPEAIVNSQLDFIPAAIANFKAAKA